jgi:hypothetical protein
MLEKTEGQSKMENSEKLKGLINGMSINSKITKANQNKLHKTLYICNVFDGDLF